MKTTPLDREIRSRIETLALELTNLIRSSALDAITGALGGAPSAAPAAPAKAAPKARRRGGKRTSAEVDAMAARFFEYVSAHAGERLEQIAAGMGESTKDLKLPVQKLLGSKSIRTEGQKRGTKYFAGGKRAGKRAKKA